jgi:hypothetical protein
MNQLPCEGTDDLSPIEVHIDGCQDLINNMLAFGSKPLASGYGNLNFHPPFSPQPLEEKDLIPAELIPGTIDSNPPSYGNISLLRADVPTQPLGPEVLKRIKDSLNGIVDGNILQPGVDLCPIRDFINIKSLPDDFSRIPGVLRDKPKPQPIIRGKLAILHPNALEFTQIGEVLKANLDPDQFSVMLIPFRSEI